LLASRNEVNYILKCGMKRLLASLLTLIVVTVVPARGDFASPKDAEIQELKAQNEQLTEQIKTLESQIALLQKQLGLPTGQTAPTSQLAPVVTATQPVSDPGANEPKLPAFLGIPSLLEQAPPDLRPKPGTEWSTFTEPKFDRWLAAHGKQLTIDKSFRVDVQVQHLRENSWRIIPSLRGDDFEANGFKSHTAFRIATYDFYADDTEVKPWLTYKQGSLHRVTGIVTEISYSFGLVPPKMTRDMFFRVTLDHVHIAGF
jgi:hypothetical protein